MKLATGSELLRLDRFDKSYPGVHAVNNVSLSFHEGRVYALLGENGAGKSTLIKMISGVVSRDGGTAHWQGDPFVVNSPREASDRGIRVIHQELSTIRQLSVLQNVFLGIEETRLGVFDERAMRERFRQLCDFIGYSMDPDRSCKGLSVADQKLLEVLKALARRARLLIMDEPTDSMGEAEKELLFRVVRRLQGQGVTIVYITHFIDEVFEIADVAIVLRDGILAGTREVNKTTPVELVEMMIGNVDFLGTSAQHGGATVSSGEPAIDVRNVYCPGVLEGVQCVARAGEVVGITGLLGAGKSELLNAIFGVMAVQHKEILCGGAPVKIRSPRDGMEHGIALVPEDRKNRGLILKHSVARNVTITNLKPLLGSVGQIVRRRETETVRRLVEHLRIKVPDSSAPVRQLSGGNQQKVVLAKWLHADRAILLLDEPTRGIDIGAKAEIYAIIHELAAAGCAVIMASSEPAEIAAQCDRIYVLREGRVVAEFEYGVSEADLMHSMLRGEAQ